MQEIDSLSLCMSSSLDSTLERGEKLDSLVDRSEHLSKQSKNFYKQANKSSSIFSGLTNGWFSSSSGNASSQSERKSDSTTTSSPFSWFSLGSSSQSVKNVESSPFEVTQSQSHNMSSILIKLISQQKSNGSFGRSESLFKFLESDIPPIPDELGVDNEEIWITLLVLAKLESDYGEERGRWELPMKKSKKWILKSLNGNEKSIEELILIVNPV